MDLKYLLFSRTKGYPPEIDISVSKLLGFETVANFLRVSVSENLVSEKKSRFQRIWSRRKSLGFGKFGIRKKVSVSVSVKILVLWTAPLSFTTVGDTLNAKFEIYFATRCR